MVALLYMLDTARVNEKTVWCLKNGSDIPSTSSYDFSWNLTKSLDSSTCTTKKFEWLGIQCAVENKDVSWNNTFSRCASTESREKIHRNRIKEKMSITHGQLSDKRQKRTMHQNQLNSAIMQYQYLQGTFRSSHREVFLGKVALQLY